MKFLSLFSKNLLRFQLNWSSAQHLNRKHSLFTEYKIKVPWGKIQSKWWGPTNVRPILALHGWQDNCGSWDRLIPLLPKHIGYLAIDFPGHGLSSNYPHGMHYDNIGYLHTLEFIRQQLGWTKMSVMAHSMGSKLMFYYMSLFPNNCDMVISLDTLKPLVRTNQQLIDDMVNQIKRLTLYSRVDQNDDIEPPCYTYEEAVNVLVVGTNGSITRESAVPLLVRSIKESTKQPGKFYFRRDIRVKMANYGTISHDLNLALTKRIICPHLFVKASMSGYFEEAKYHHETIDALKQANPLFRILHVDGTHHVHMNEPTLLNVPLSDFINQNRPLTIN